jgi:RNA polymerase sigma-70 factor (ECF subfamily)
MDAEDILQEGFVKVFNNLHKFRGDGSFDGWVRRIFVNTSIEHIRRKSITTIADEGYEKKLLDTNTNALENLFEKDIIKTTQVLSDGYRTVFTLYAIEGYSHKEIAARLGITESTSKSQFSRAKALLRNMLTHQPARRSAACIV